MRPSPCNFGGECKLNCSVLDDNMHHGSLFYRNAITGVVGCQLHEKAVVGHRIGTRHDAACPTPQTQLLEDKRPLMPVQDYEQLL